MRDQPLCHGAHGQASNVDDEADEMRMSGGNDARGSEQFPEIIIHGYELMELLSD
jgi:hypothetical protein